MDLRFDSSKDAATMKFDTRHGRLGFVREARRAFAFLLDLGFVEVASTDTKLAWASPEVDVEVFHGPQSYIMGVELRRHADGGAGVHLSDALQVVKPDLSALARYQTSKQEQIEPGVQQLATLVRDHCQPLLVGDKELWGRVHELVRSGRVAYNLAARFAGHRQRAEDAWRARDYATALLLYREMAGAMTAAERRRVDYMTRRISDD